MRNRLFPSVILVGVVACTSHSPSAPSPSGFSSATVIHTYDVTLTASSSCEVNLPENARRRRFTVMLRSDGHLDWRGAQLKLAAPLISSAVSEGGQFSFNIDVDRDPMSDQFHGLREDLGDGTSLEIAGKGAGTAGGEGSISGPLDGVFAFYDTAGPPPNTRTGHYCQANDHRFTFVPW